MNDINELIADAKAEEEVIKEQKIAKKESFKKELRESLKSMLADLAPQEEQTVRVPLSEYISLVYIAREVEVLKQAISIDLSLNYIKDDTRISDGYDIVSAFKLLYKDEYDEILKNLLKNEGE